MDFLPSVNGFHFANNFPSVPLCKILCIPIGNAGGGLCGGMVFAALDCFLDGTQPPPMSSSLFHYLEKRLIDSLHIPLGVLRFYAWMSCSNIKGMLKRQIEILKSKIIYKPVPLGLIREHSYNPLNLANNHQVLAYKISSNKIYIYDPNYPDDNSVYLLLGDKITHSIDGDIYGIFVNRYRNSTPQ